MSAIKRLFRSNPNDATVPLSNANILSWLGGSSTAAGVAVTEARAYGLPAYYRAVVITAGTLAGLPIKVFRNGTREKVTTRTVLDGPNPRQTPFEFWFTMYANEVTWGNAFARKFRDGAGGVAEVWPIHPSRVKVEEVDPSAENRSGKLFIVEAKGGQKRYTDRDIFHMPFLSWDGVSGIRPLELFRQALGIAIAGDDTAAGFMRNGSRLEGILTSDTLKDDDVADRMKARWKQVNSGPSNAGDIAVLGQGLTYQSISLPPADIQLLQSRQWSVSEIGRMIGTPPHLIGDVTKSTSWGTGIEEQVLGWVKFNLQAYISSTEQRITGEILPGGLTGGSWYAKIILEGLLRGDAKTRAALYHSAITDGWMNRNEVRELEDREPVDGLDEYIVPSNMAIISVDGTATPVAPPPAPPPEEEDPEEEDDTGDDPDA